jgi:hypothetical protein
VTISRGEEARGRLASNAPDRVGEDLFREGGQGRASFRTLHARFEFFFPKYGVGRGPEEFREFASGLWAAGFKSQHHRNELEYMASGRHVVVEGATVGSDAAGGTWDGGKTPGGRFCSVFDFDGEGLISRMFIYLDPDYTSLDTDRFHWKRAIARW